LNELYNAADVTVSNSWEESFGLTLAESYMTETPVISRPVGIANELTSSVRIFRTREELFEAIHSINKQKSSVDLFSLETCTKLHTKLYNETINRP
jgi:glycosyltransferase involved in cell wall biosynthesis